MKAEVAVALLVLAIVAGGLSPVLLVVGLVFGGLYALAHWIGGGRKVSVRRTRLDTHPRSGRVLCPPTMRQ